MSYLRRLTVIALLGLCLLALGTTHASAWWLFWAQPSAQKQPAKPPMVQVPKAFSGARAAECNVGDGSVSRFADTAYARGSVIVPDLSHETRRRLSALRMAYSLEQAENIAAPLLTGSDEQLAAITRVALARVLIGRQSSWPGATALAETILAQPAEPLSDAAYLRAVLRFAQRDWTGAEREVSVALEKDPAFYNAAVLRALLLYQRANRADLSCAAFYADLAHAIAPVLEAGACPVHVAHLSLALRRYLPERPGPGSARNRAITQLVLSYVARNDSLCATLKDSLLRDPVAADCSGVLDSLTCGASK